VALPLVKYDFSMITVKYDFISAKHTKENCRLLSEIEYNINFVRSQKWLRNSIQVDSKR